MFADLGTVEHRVEGSNLVNLHWSHLKSLGHLVHRGESQEVIVLFLHEE